MIRLEDIVKQYCIEDFLVNYEKISRGKINETYLIHMAKKDYFLQKINSTVFNEPTATIRNIEYVTVNDKNHLFPKLIYTNGNRAYATINGDVWRMYEAAGKRIIKEELHLKDFYLLGKRVAQMHEFLGTKKSVNITSTIPDFCNVSKRINELRMEYKNSSRKNDLIEEIYDFLDKRSKSAREFDKLLRDSNLKKGIIHNDLTINNIVWNDDLKNYVFIDLDTLNVGTILYDLGELIRNTAAVNNNGQITFDIDICKQIILGYITGYKERISKKEISLIPISIWIMTYSICTRYLIDYLKHNIYFSITYEEENLYRAREKMILLRDIEKKKNEILEL